MSGAFLALMFSVGALAIGAGLVMFRQSGWPAADLSGEASVTASFRTLEKEARESVIRDAVVLATELSRVDDFIAPTEVNSIRDFILAHVAENQVADITGAMRAGMKQPASSAVVQQICERIRGDYALGHRELVAHFLVHVAHADGLLCPEEKAFLERVVPEIGVAPGALSNMISAYDEWARAQLNAAAG
jgi:hypothetical protein